MKLNKYDIVLFRGSEHTVLKEGKVGDNPDKPDGEYYSHEKCYRIASTSHPDEKSAFELGYWIPERLLTKVGKTHSFGVEEAPVGPTVSERVLTSLESGSKTIGEISKDVSKPSAAIFSTLSALIRKGLVIYLENENQYKKNNQ